MRVKSSLASSLLAVILLATPAASHDLLVDIYPAAGQSVEESSFEAKLTFNNPLLVVSGETNAELSTKPVGSDQWTSHEVSIQDRVLSAQVVISEPGDYDLRWKVVSSDGHPISGDSTFTLAFTENSSDSTSDQPMVISPNPATTEAEPERSLVGFYIGLAMVAIGAIFAPIGLLIRRRAKKS